MRDVGTRSIRGWTKNSASVCDGPRIRASFRDTAARAAVAKAAAPGEVVFVDSLDAIDEHFGSATAVIAILDCQNVTADEAVIWWRRTRRRHITVQLILFFDLAPGAVRHALALAPSVTSESFAFGYGELAAKLRDIDTPRDTFMEMVDEVDGALSTAGKRVFKCCVQISDQVPTRDAVAKRLDTSGRNLARWLSAERSPSFHILAMWSRLVHAAALLRAPDPQSVDRIAVQIGLADAPTLVRVFRRYAHLRPTDVRADNGVDVFLRGLLGR